MNIASPNRGCLFAQALYLKANGELPCWDDVGEAKILRKLDPEALANDREANIAHFPEMVRIRRAFADGRVPHPGLCETCAVRGHGQPIVELRPTALEVLHVEPSYLCGLACPQCIHPQDRKRLKPPPYHLAPEAYEGFLRGLKADGIEHIRLAIFEGRGEPLNNPKIDALLALTRQYFPRTPTSLTTHGNFRFRPWMVEGNLDILRFSVDGARQESYGKYRIGGKITTVFRLMEDLRDAIKNTNAALYVEWKYILFEWNDSDQELEEAARLATDFGAHLRLTRTHSPGRSIRFSTEDSVFALARRLGLETAPDLTFQLKSSSDWTSTSSVLTEILCKRAVAAQRGHDQVTADRNIALLADEIPPSGDVLKKRLGDLLNTRDPGVAVALANVAAMRHDFLTALSLFEHYLSLAPSARDVSQTLLMMDRIESERYLLLALAFERQGRRDQAEGFIVRGLAHDPGDAQCWIRGDLAGLLAQVRNPSTVYALAAILRLRRQTDQAGLCQAWLGTRTPPPTAGALTATPGPHPLGT